MRIRAWMFIGAVASTLSLTTLPKSQAAPALPQPAPTRTLPKLANPAGTAKAIAALARFANGQLGQDPYDLRVGQVLGKRPTGKATAKRLVEAIEAMPVVDRGKLFPGVAKLESLTTHKFDRATFEQVAANRWAKVAHVNVTVLPPDPHNAYDKPQYELVYSGLKVAKTADADASDEAVVYLNVLSHTQTSNPKYLPAAGTIAAASGAVVTSHAGPAWSSPTWPGGWNSGIVIVSGVLEDDGDLELRKQELELLVQFALSEAEEDPQTPDRMEVLRRELEDALALLHLANPARWSARAIQVRKLTAMEYDELYLKPSTQAPVAHKLTARHDPRGADYTIYFDIPPPKASYKRVFVKLKEVEALGPDRDAAENKIADLGARVAISGNAPAEATRVFTRNKNLVQPGWTVEREAVAVRPLNIRVRLFDDDPSPDCACLSSGSWPMSGCGTYCAAPTKKETCGVFIKSMPGASGAAYGGPCPHAQTEYDIHPLANSGVDWQYQELNFSYDLATNKLSGDLNGSPGTFTVLGTDGAGNRARVVLEVGLK